MSNLYETDFYAWTKAQAEALKRGDFSHADLANIIEEIETMGRSEKREFLSRLEVLLTHLLKWQFQFIHRSNSWRLTIKEQRRRIVNVLQDNPSLKPLLAASIAEVYQAARDVAADETGMSIDAFPADCPFTQEQLFDPQWLPDPT